MIALTLILPGLAPLRLEIPEPEGRPDALDILGAAIARIEGGDWRGVLETGRRAQAKDAPPTQPEPHVTSPEGVRGRSGGSVR